jgi:signal transduction histidine kinase
MEEGSKAAAADTDRLRKAHPTRRSQRLYMLALVAGSYVTDGLLLLLFAWTGTVPYVLPAAFVAAGLVSCGLFYFLLTGSFSDRFRDHYLTAWQMATHIAIELVFLALYPGIGFFFLNTLFIIFLFGSLRMTAGQATLLLLSVAAALAAVLSQIGDRLGMPHATAQEVILVLLSYMTTLARCAFIGHYGIAVSLMLRKLRDELERRVAQRTKQLESVNQALQQSYGELEAFSYSVAHDLRNPLRGINGYCSILAEEYADRKLDVTAHQYLGRIRAGTERLGKLIDALLDLARISRARLQPQDVDLSAMVQEIAASILKTNPQREADFVIAHGLCARADRKLMRIVLENLIGNAWKFTAGAERARIEFGQEAIDGMPAFFVRDNGIGFDIAYGDKLFGHFQKLHSDQESEGTGIGLAMVERILRLHGGRVWAEGAPGRGATFHFRL